MKTVRVRIIRGFVYQRQDLLPDPDNPNKTHEFPAIFAHELIAAGKAELCDEPSKTSEATATVGGQETGGGKKESKHAGK